ncbi:MAG: hypothetical protein ACOX4G_09780 [Limnochordia bacterium]|jgi:hypothetical protein
MSLLREQCKVRRLDAVPRVFNEITHDGNEQYLTELFAEELRVREGNRVRRALKRAAFACGKTLQDYCWDDIALPQRQKNTRPIHPEPGKCDFYVLDEWGFCATTSAWC